MLIAKEDITARALRRAWETRSIQKTYLAIVHGHPAVETETIDAPLGRDLDSHVAIKDKVIENGSAAQTTWRLLRKFTRNEKLFSLLEVQPHSGRKHQIRIHLAHVGHAIVGDKIYGPDENLYIDFISERLTDAQRAQLILPHHALHAQRLEFPLNRQPMIFEAPPEAWFAAFLEKEEEN